MDSAFQPENSLLSNDFEITPESESIEDLAPREDEPQPISGFGADSGNEENLQDIGNPVVLGFDQPIQPESESLHALPESESNDDLPLRESASGEVSTSLPTTGSLLVRPSTQPGMASVRQDDPQQEFAESIRNGNYMEAVATVVSQLCHLEIVTIVEDEDDLSNMVESAPDQGLPGQRIITRMDLVGGDITKVIGKRFVERSEYKPLQEIHNQQVAEGLGIMKNNLENLVKAINSLKSLKNLDNIS
jgi:hypothetical protein